MSGCSKIARVARTLTCASTVLVMPACSGDAMAPEPEPAASVAVSPASSQVDVGASVQFRAEVRDASGNVLQGHPVSWSSVDDRIAAAAADGLVRGVATGQTRIRATADAVTGEAAVEVLPPGGIVLLATEPEVLIEGEPATLTGTGFSPDAAQNQVLVGGVNAAVLGASPSQLEIRVPSTEGCTPARNAPVQVRIGGLASDVLTRRVRPTQLLELEPGKIAVFTDDLCIRMEEASGPSRYLIGLQSVSEDAALLTPAQLVAARGAGAATTPAAGHDAAGQGRARMRETGGSFGVRAGAQGLPAMLPLHPRFHPGQPARATTRPAAGSTSLPEPGDVLSLRVWRELCSTWVTVDAIVRVVGEHAIWLEDGANPPAGLTTADFQELSRQFDETTYPTTVSFFGPPTDIDDNGRVLILFSLEVNRLGTFGFVRGRDFGPDRESCAASNHAEIFYIFVPDPGGSAWQPLSREWALAFLPSLIAHEFVHVLQGARRIEARLGGVPGVVNPSEWETEGQAELGTELVELALENRMPGQNYGFAEAFSNTYRRVRFMDLRMYFGYASAQEKVAGAPEQCGWLTGAPAVGGPCSIGFQDPSGVQFFSIAPIYSAGWSFFRWLSDQYGPAFPGGAAGLNRALLEAHPQLRGFANVEAVLGVPMRQLLARWAAMLYIDDHPDAVQRDPLRMTSWNLHDIFQNQPPSARLQPRQRSFSAFQDDVSVRSGSTAYWLISGASQPSLAIRATNNGEPLGPHMQLWIVRLHE